jgi:hypothetical protein
MPPLTVPVPTLAVGLTPPVIVPAGLGASAFFGSNAFFRKPPSDFFSSSAIVNSPYLLIFSQMQSFLDDALGLIPIPAFYGASPRDAISQAVLW